VATTVESLDPHARRLLTACLEAMDPLWDPAVGLVEGPSDDHPVRSTSRYALGLLVRGGEGDRERAATAIDAVLENQFVDDPEAVYYGTWARTPAEHHPMEEPVEWEDYDPNWREFVGTTLATVHDEFGDDLPGGLSGRIADAIRRAAVGTLERDVSPSYTNIALMRSFLLYWAADRFDEDEWEQAAETFTARVHELFSVGDSFCEFNSPTYNGVSLNALGYWLTSPRTEPLYDRGAEMETALWRQIGEFYHAGLQTVCGPYDRAYRMDTRRSTSDYYVWLAAGGTDRDPFPESHHTSMPANFGSAIVAAVLRGWAAAPDDAVAHFRSFRGDRRVDYDIGCSAHTSSATAWLGEEVMVGGFSFEEGYTHRGSTLRIGTIHWRVEGDTIGWGRVLDPADRQPDVRAERNELHVGGDAGQEIAVELCAPDIDPNGVDADGWELAGLDVAVAVDAAETTVTRSGDDRVTVRYAPDPGDRLALTVRLPGGA